MSWRVWLVTDVYPPGCGGSGWSAHALARTLRQQGHEVEIVAVDAGRHGLTQRTFEGLPITEVGLRHARRSLRRRLGARDLGHVALQSYLSARLADEPGVDVVHAQHLHSGPPALAAARQHGRAAVLTVRDYWPVCLHGTSWWSGEVCPGCSRRNLTGCMREYWGWPAPLAAAMVPWARRRLAARQSGVAAAHRVVAVSEAVRRRIGPELEGVEIAVVPNIVDAAEVEAQIVEVEAEMAAAEAEMGRVKGPAAAATPTGGGSAPQVERFGTGAAGVEATGLQAADEATPYLLTAGKLNRHKGFDSLLEALHACGCRWPLLVAGAGPELAALQRQAAELGVDARFLGWLEHRRLLRLARGARALLLPSAWEEPLSRLVLESMAIGVPLIAWARGGNAEVIEDGRDGWLVRVPADVAAALGELEEVERRAAVATAARGSAERRFSPAAVYPVVASIYAAALERAGRDAAAPRGHAA